MIINNESSSNPITIVSNSTYTTIKITKERHDMTGK